MSRRTAVALAAAAIVGALVVVWLVARAPDTSRGTGDEADEPRTLDLATATEVDLRLLFPSTSGRLQTEERAIPNPGSLEAVARRTVEELLLGPSEPGLVAPFPPSIELADLFVSADGVIYVDLLSPDDAPPPSSGSHEELLSVYSIVNSLLLTAPDLRSVALLWNGVQRSSFAGHLDTSRPLRFKRDLVAG